MEFGIWVLDYGALAMEMWVGGKKSQPIRSSE